MQVSGTAVKAVFIVDTLGIGGWEGMEHLTCDDVLDLARRHFPLDSLPDHLELVGLRTEQSREEPSVWRVGITVRFKKDPPADLVSRILQQDYANELLRYENSLIYLVVEEALQPYDCTKCPFTPEDISIE